MRSVAFLIVLLCLGMGAEVRAQSDWSLTRDRSGRKRPGNKGRTAKRRTRKATASVRQRGDRLIKRYMRVLLDDPSQEVAFQRLVNLVRERDGHLEGLSRELEQRLQGDAESFELNLLLGHVNRERGQLDQARQAYRRASELSPESIQPLLAWARLERESDNLPKASGLLGEALSLSRSDERRRDLYRQLAETALDMGDFQAASQYYGELASNARGSVYALTEYARALVARSQHARAAAEYRSVLAKIRGDDRVIAPILLEMARAELASGDADGAIETLLRARWAARPRTGVRWEINETLLEAFRSGDRLQEYARMLTGDRSGGRFETNQLLGRIWDELGDREKALQAFRRALRHDPRHIDTRVRLIQLLSREGKLDEVATEYRALIRAAPGEPRFVVQLGKFLMERAKREEALGLLERTSRRFPREANIHQALFELYSQWGENERALAEIKILTRIEPGEPMHLVVLGEQLMAQGRRDEALAAWRRIPRVDSDKARAHATLGGLYLDHDLPLEALREYQEACRLRDDDITFARGLAEVLERLNRPGEAARRWQRVLQLSGDRGARRQARRRMVSIWARSRQLQRRIAENERIFSRIGELRGGAVDNQNIEDVLEAGRFLAEAFQQMARLDPKSSERNRRRAEHILQRLISFDSSDVESLLALERLRLARGDEEGALEVLRLLVEADPHNARAYYSRMADHALTLYRDDEAEAYAEKAVQLNRDDSEAQRRLGDLYRAKQDVPNAIASYRRAIELNDRSFPTYLTLAEVYLAGGETGQADSLLRRVIRSSPDDDLVVRAARASIQIHRGKGTLESLESDLLPLTLANPERPVYRRLLVELYDALIRPLIRETRTAASSRVTSEPEGPAQPDDPRQSLHVIGKRELRPLLDALRDKDPGQRRTAVEILGELGNPAAAIPLLSIAEGTGDIGLRRRALIGAGKIAQAALAPRFIRIAEGPERRLRGVATWALARIGGDRAVLAMRRLVDNAMPAVRAYAALGLGREGDIASLDRIEKLLREDPRESVRLCAVLALGYLNDSRSVPLLITALHAQPGQIPVAAALTLTNMGEKRSWEALAEAVFSPDQRKSDAALRGMSLMAGDMPKPTFILSDLPAPSESSGFGEVHIALPGITAAARGQDAFVRFADVLLAAARDALRGPVESVYAVLRVLSDRIVRDQDDATAAATRSAVRSLALSLLPDLLEVSRHPDPAVRSEVLRFLAALDDESAGRALLAALDDGDETVQRTVLELLGDSRAVEPEFAVDRISVIAARHPGWSMRARAIAVLARIGGREAEKAIVAALGGDPYAYVRYAAAGALGKLASASSVPALAKTLDRDPEAEVRAAAVRALGNIGGPEAEAALARARADTHPAVQAALHRLRSAGH